MPADTQIPISGKDVRMELLQNGVPQAFTAQVVNFTETVRYSEIETKPIGTSDTYIDQDADGWEGEIELAQNSAQVELFIDLYDFNVRNRIPQNVTITRTKFFRDGTSNLKTYSFVRLNYSSTARRGSAGAVRMSWKSGVARV